MKLSGTTLCCCIGVLLLSFGAVLPGRAQTGDLEAGLSNLQVGYEIYQVQPGDTVENIAARFGVDAARIRAVNQLEEDARLAPGQSLAIILPGRPRPRQPEVAVEPAAADDGAEATTFSPRYAAVTRACTITSARPPLYGRALWQCDPGDRVVVNSQQGEYLAVVMLGGSTGWIPAGAAQVTDDTISQEEMNKMLQSGEGRMEMVYEAMRYLGTPYRYGGSLPRTVDCSLLVQTVFARNGVHLPRTAAEQCDVGQPVSAEGLQPGDRLYFINRSGRINHTALYIGNGQFIHASSNRGCVAIDSLSSPYYAARFYGARRS
jgi:LysM repeat protein